MKKLIFGMLVAVTAVGGSVATYASTMFNSNGKLAPTWFRYHGGDPSDKSNYTATVSLPSECQGGSVLCAILATPDPESPNNPIVDSQTNFANKFTN